MSFAIELLKTLDNNKICWQIFNKNLLDLMPSLAIFGITHTYSRFTVPCLPATLSANTSKTTDENSLSFNWNQLKKILKKLLNLFFFNKIISLLSACSTATYNLQTQKSTDVIKCFLIKFKFKANAFDIWYMRHSLIRILSATYLWSRWYICKLCSLFKFARSHSKHDCSFACSIPLSVIISIISKL